MKRTIKRISLKLNKGKWEILLEIARAYAKQKDYFFLSYAPPASFALYKRYTEPRNELVKASFVSPTGLQARMWKVALKDAFESVDRNWLALGSQLRPQVAWMRDHNRFDKVQAHYAFWVLKKSQRMAALVSGKEQLPQRFNVPGAKKVRSFLKRKIRQQRGHNPRVRSRRSFALDGNMYRIFEHKGRQYISIMTLVPRQRILIPLTGNTPIRGTIRVVLDFDKQRIEVHYVVEVSPKKAKGAPVAVDLGITEVMTDSDGSQWGKGFGKTLIKYSKALNNKGKARNKLHALRKKAHTEGDKAKAKRIRVFNLGRNKQNKKRKQVKQTLAREINTAINGLLLAKSPRLIVHEKLGAMRGRRGKGKNFNRLVHLWTHGLMKDRLGFKASVGGSDRKQVNPAYTSQMCPRCGFVHRKNRFGDTFRCLFCRQAGHSDRLAALNLLNRADDPEIARWTPLGQVKTILMSRFQRRLESWDFEFPPDQVNWAALGLVGLKVPATVPGRTEPTGPPVLQVAQDEK